ncbi:MAG: EscR/YscR/HrcR family type III secretion system export apparatus protein, partial [Deltaproteobacteria bacterium]|nr:EscR/YscR/HrcR family type III secretion system export apparatus protein [Deltaproteobacteria bacterium]
MKRKLLIGGGLSTFLLGLSGVAYAQAGQIGVSKPLVLLIVLAALSLVPFVVMMITSFVKIAVVLSLIRNALGTQQVPPNLIITGLAMILTVYIMVPVGYDVYRAAGKVINQGTNQPLLSQVSIELLKQAVAEGKEPVREFLLKHVHPAERELFYNLSLKLRTKAEDRNDITDQDFINLIPAFVVSELSEA